MAESLDSKADREMKSKDGNIGTDGLDKAASSVGAQKDDSFAESSMPHWLRYFAIFGDSTAALGLSFVFLLLSVGTAWFLDEGSSAEFFQPKPVDLAEEAYRKLGPIPNWIETSVPVLEWTEDPSFIRELKASFDRDGVIALRGLLEPNLLQRLDEASSYLIQEEYEKKQAKPRGALTSKMQEQRQASGTQFFTVKEGAVFLGLNVTNDDSESTTPPFLEVALQSKIPQVISQVLLQLPSNETLRLMRDIFLAKDADEYICGWHVDDTGFWPAVAEAPGVNAWIALDDMPVGGGGGFALAVGSHTAAWREEAYHVTGSTHTFPPEGFTSAMDIVDRRVGNGTCNIATAAPHLHRRMEETKRIYNMKRGDVILHTRWLFHRTVPFERSLVQDRQENEPPLLYRRYSLRYGPGTSEIPRGYGTEPSVLWDVQNGGRTADQVAVVDAPWYPQAWPPAPNTQKKQLEEIATERLPKVLKQADVRRQQMRHTRRVAARQQRHHQPH